MNSAVECAISVIKEAISIHPWEVDNGIFPKPNLEDGKIYSVKDLFGTQFFARFSFGEGEYWWEDIETGGLVSVAEFQRFN